MLEPLPVYHDPQSYVYTSSGNKVSRRSVLCGSQNIVLNGKAIVKDGVILRGDLASVNIGRGTLIGKHTVLRPPIKSFKEGVAYFPIQIGEYTQIEDDCLISSVSIGGFCKIGNGAILGARSIVKDCVKILPNSIVGPDMVLPPFTIWGGSPARIVGQLSPATQSEFGAEAKLKARLFQKDTK